MIQCVTSRVPQFNQSANTLAAEQMNMLDLIYKPQHEYRGKESELLWLFLSLV